MNMEENREVLESKEELIARIENKIAEYESQIKGDLTKLSKIPGFEDIEDLNKMISSLRERLQNLKN